jgi:hypothetical protein
MGCLVHGWIEKWKDGLMKRLDQKKWRWPESDCCSPLSFAVYIETEVSCSISIPCSNCSDTWPVCQRVPDVAEFGLSTPAQSCRGFSLAGILRKARLEARSSASRGGSRCLLTWKFVCCLVE